TIYFNWRSRTQSPTTQHERDKALARQQFTKNFRDMQLLGQGLLREHEAKRLTSKRLAKDAKSINRCAKSLRSLLALGNLASETQIDKDIDTPNEFDESIRKLAKLIWDFAHNPIHQTSKVFNTDQAAQAQTDLLTIINLSKVIENRAKSYVFAPTSAQ
ncbi:MAG: hypothetical protein L0220_01135, partial [Acidobacteria bacterium]|nr:hypothetical protein [Acidobacteriota bacterium]